MRQGGEAGCFPGVVKVSLPTLKRLIKRVTPPWLLEKILTTMDEITYIQPLRFPGKGIIQSPAETLSACMKILEETKPGAYCRFGDGEIYLMNGRRDREQAMDPGLRQELKLVLQVIDKPFLKALAIHSDQFGLEPHMTDGVHRWPDRKAKKLLFLCYEHFIGQRIYSAVALHYALVYQRGMAVEFLMSIGEHRPIFVGGEHNSEDVIRRLFNASALVKTPSRNGYAAIDRVESELINEIEARNGRYTVVVLACGASGKALIGRLYGKYKNLFMFDAGSIVEVFQGETKWLWVSIANKPPSYWEGLLSELEHRRSGVSVSVGSGRGC